MGRTALVILSLALGFGCGASSPPGAAADPWGELAPKAAINRSSAPNVVEVSLQARPSTHVFEGTVSTPVWTYDGAIPGPLLDAKVGDELIVHFTNHLPEETTIHWHGVRVPNAMDGVMGVTPATPPGGSFDYRFTLKDAGLFWYHPHVRSDEQVNKGLYGVIRVRGPNEPVVDHEGIVVLDDIGLMPDGTIPTFLDDESKMMGRGGGTILFNGRRQPIVPWRAGALERLRFVNAANGRFFNLRIEGHTLRVIGTDGGLLPEPYDTERVLVPPGKRFDVLVIPKGAAGATAVLWDEPYDRGHDSGADPALQVATFRVSDEAPLSGRVLPSRFPDLERLPTAGAVDHTIELDEKLDPSGETLFTINGRTGMDVPMLHESLGAVRRFEVKNLSEMDHPFHLHGFFFQLYERNGVALAPARLANEDTVVVPAMSSMRFVTRFDAPGTWPYHCHILEHAEAGMMGMIEVAP